MVRCVREEQLHEQKVMVHEEDEFELEEGESGLLIGRESGI